MLGDSCFVRWAGDRIHTAPKSPPQSGQPVQPGPEAVQLANAADKHRPWEPEHSGHSRRCDRFGRSKQGKAGVTETYSGKIQTKVDINAGFDIHFSGCLICAARADEDPPEINRMVQPEHSQSSRQCHSQLHRCRPAAALPRSARTSPSDRGLAQRFVAPPAVAA